MKTVVLALALALTAGATPLAPASAAPPKGLRCPKLDRDPSVYGIGGSTMGSLLGPMLQKVFAEHAIGFKRWGKASTGLARPDFHDWPAEAPGVMRKNKPDIVVVSLGTNDYQPLWVDGGKWIPQEDERWAEVYGERVDALLEALAKGDPERLIVWSGPYAFEGDNAEKRAPIVNRIMRERVEAFAKNGGHAVFHDAYAPTSDDDGRPLKKAVLKGKKAVKIRSKDGVHLTAEAVRALLAKPIVDMVLPCFTKKHGKGKGHSAEAAPSEDDAAAGEVGEPGKGGAGDGAEAAGDAPKGGTTKKPTTTHGRQR